VAPAFRDSWAVARSLRIIPGLKLLSWTNGEVGFLLLRNTDN